MVEIIREFGLPTGMLMIILVFSGVGLRWFAKNVAQPFIKAHLELIAHLQESLGKEMELHQELQNKMEWNEEDHAKIIRLLKDK